MEYETAGDPVTGLKWTRKTTQKIAEELLSIGISVSRTTVGSLLKEMNFSLKVNHKKLATNSGDDRDLQFQYIRHKREKFANLGNPTISVDAKKKELVGQFKNPGAAWNQEPVAVHDHDFRSLAKGIAVPYGVYDVLANEGCIFVGTSRDTAQFAVDAIERWWATQGCRQYPNTTDLLILADSGGSNGSRLRLWKSQLQEKLCDRHGITVTVTHYPPGTSKWNPIEHRLFSEISKNWAGKPLDSYETILKYIRTTTTTTGLKVKAEFVRKKYCTGVKIPDSRMRELNLVHHEILPLWNYTLSPSTNGK